MLTIDIVTHNYRYSRLAMYQMSSLVLFPPERVRVRHVMYVADQEADDPNARRLAVYFRDHPACQRPTVAWEPRTMEKQYLMRRAVGRDDACRRTTADWVWFADADMLFGPGALDTLADRLRDFRGKMAYPKQVTASVDHAAGDELIEAAAGPPRLVDFMGGRFAPMRYNRAIGGVQVVRGDVARSVGYCRGSKWQRPEKVWKRTFEDAEFRRTIGTDGTGLDVPNVYRIRHSKRGREHPGVEL